MTKSYDERRHVAIDGYEYLVDDDDMTAWIVCGPQEVPETYAFPERVNIEGRSYLVTSVEIGAFSFVTPPIKELVVHDSIEYIDEDSFHMTTVRTVRIGKGLKWYHPWLFSNDLERVFIDRDNPYIRMSADGNFVLTADGRTLLAVISDPEEIRIPEGVETISECAISCKALLKKVTLPSTLKIIEENGIFECHALPEIIVPEGTVTMRHQGISYNESLRRIDLPATLETVGWEVCTDNGNLEELTLRCPEVVSLANEEAAMWRNFVPKDNCRLVVPGHLTEAYGRHPLWGLFKHIEPLSETIADNQ